MRGFNTIICVLVVLAFFSCNKHSRLLLQDSEVDYYEHSTFVLEGKELNLDGIGLDDIMLCDSLLLFITGDAEGIMKVYDPKTCHEVAHFGYFGRAKNEFKQPMFIHGSQYKRDGKTIVPVIDGGSLLIEMDFTNSVREKNVVVEHTEYMDFGNYYEESISFLDNDIIKFFHSSRPERDFVLKKWNAPYFEVVNKDDKHQIPVYSKITKTDSEDCYSAMYSGVLYKHPSKNMFVYPFLSRDYIFFFDLDNENYFSIHQKGVKSFDDKYLKSSSDYGRMTFTNALATNDFIIANYCGGSYFKQGFDSENYCTELILFDWDGNYLCGLKIGLNINRTAYDPERKILFGLDRVREKVYEFDFAPIVDYINENAQH